MIAWQQGLRARVAKVLRSATPGNCELIAARILPIAARQDGEARRVRVDVVPRLVSAHGGRRFPLPLKPASRARIGLAADDNWWEHHSVRVSAHCVDVLPGADGVPVDEYLSTYFDYADVLELAEVD